MIIDYYDSTYEDEIPLSVSAEIIMLITIFVALPLILPLGTIILLVLRIRKSHDLFVEQKKGKENVISNKEKNDSL